ncbi:MAG TPA: flavodoxin family protein [Lachnospiraceae bacterium]|nr:flavodoxin family protein [Lachnospiraceae bacterium]
MERKNISVKNLALQTERNENMKILILHGSARTNGVTGQLAEQFSNGAQDAGHSVSKIELKEKGIKDCIGCGACQKNNGKCVQQDDMTEIYSRMLEADVIVFASPVYFYTWTSMMKRVLDRTFAVESLLSNKKFFLISSGAAPEEKYMQTMFDSYHQYISCFRGEGNTDAGYLMAYGMNTPADVANTDYLRQAYDIGNKI